MVCKQNTKWTLTHHIIYIIVVHQEAELIHVFLHYLNSLIRKGFDNSQRTHDTGKCLRFVTTILNSFWRLGSFQIFQKKKCSFWKGNTAYVCIFLLGLPTERWIVRRLWTHYTSFATIEFECVLVAFIL